MLLGHRKDPTDRPNTGVGLWCGWLLIGFVASLQTSLSRASLMFHYSLHQTFPEHECCHSDCDQSHGCRFKPLSGLLLDHVDILLNTTSDHGEVLTCSASKGITMSWSSQSGGKATHGGYDSAARHRLEEAFKCNLAVLARDLVSYSYRLTFQKDLQCNKVSAVTTVQTWIL